MADLKRELLSWGANSYGQLGQGNSEDLLIPTPVDRNDLAFALCDLASIEGGGGHTLFLTDSGKCYSCGSNNKGQLGLGIKDENVLRATCIKLQGKEVHKVAAGWDFSFLITGDKKLYSFGSNAFGQLGLEHVKDSCDQPHEVCISEDVIDVSCGLRHTVILTVSGIVYSCGAARKGQLGVKFDREKSPRDVGTFTQVTLPLPEGPARPQVCSVVAGAYHSAALTDTGQVLIWGDNKRGQLTLNPSETSRSDVPYLIPQSCFNGHKLTKIVSGWTHMIAVTESGSMYTWGRGEYGQLGRDVGTTCDYTPTVITVSNPLQIATGSEHNLTNIGGVLYSWGWNEHGMCGTGDEDNVRYPQVVEGLKQYRCELLGCGAGHSLAIVSHIS